MQTMCLRSNGKTNPETKRIAPVHSEPSSQSSASENVIPHLLGKITLLRKEPNKIVVAAKIIPIIFVKTVICG